MKVTDPLTYRGAILCLNGIALVLAVVFAVGEAAWRMFGPNSYGPILLGILTPLLGFLALTAARQNRPVLLAAITTSGVVLLGLVAPGILLFRSLFLVGLPLSDSDWWVFLLALPLFVAPLGNIVICSFLWSRRTVPRRFNEQVQR